MNGIEVDYANPKGGDVKIKKVSARKLSIIPAIGLGLACSIQSNSFFSFADWSKRFSFTPYRIRSIEKVSPDCKLIEFELADPNQEFGIKPISTVGIKGPKGYFGWPLIKPYTPITVNSDKGHFKLLIKIYPDGPMTSYIDKFQVGDSLEIIGPRVFTFRYEPNMKKEIGLIAGGAGITPMLQLIKSILSDPNDHTKITLLFSNRHENDILLKKEFDDLATKYPNFKVEYIVSQPEENTTWKGHKGHISKELIKNVMPQASSDNLILVCGPPGFMSTIAGTFCGRKGGLLRELGYSNNMIVRL